MIAVEEWREALAFRAVAEPFADNEGDLSEALIGAGYKINDTKTCRKVDVANILSKSDSRFRSAPWYPKARRRRGSDGTVENVANHEMPSFLARIASTWNQTWHNGKANRPSPPIALEFAMRDDVVPLVFDVVLETMVDYDTVLSQMKQAAFGATEMDTTLSCGLREAPTNLEAQQAREILCLARKTLLRCITRTGIENSASAPESVSMIAVGTREATLIDEPIVHQKQDSSGFYAVLPSTRSCGRVAVRRTVTIYSHHPAILTAPPAENTLSADLRQRSESFIRILTNYPNQLIVSTEDRRVICNAMRVAFHTNFTSSIHSPGGRYSFWDGVSETSARSTVQCNTRVAMFTSYGIVERLPVLEYKRRNSLDISHMLSQLDMVSTSAARNCAVMTLDYRKPEVISILHGPDEDENGSTTTEFITLLNESRNVYVMLALASAWTPGCFHVTYVSNLVAISKILQAAAIYTNVNCLSSATSTTPAPPVGSSVQIDGMPGSFHVGRAILDSALLSDLTRIMSTFPAFDVLDICKRKMISAFASLDARIFISSLEYLPGSAFVDVTSGEIWSIRRKQGFLMELARRISVNMRNHPLRGSSLPSVPRLVEESIRFGAIHTIGTCCIDFLGVDISGTGIIGHEALDARYEHGLCESVYLTCNESEWYMKHSHVSFKMNAVRHKTKDANVGFVIEGTKRDAMVWRYCESKRLRNIYHIADHTRDKSLRPSWKHATNEFLLGERGVFHRTNNSTYVVILCSTDPVTRRKIVKAKVHCRSCKCRCNSSESMWTEIDDAAIIATLHQACAPIVPQKSTAMKRKLSSDTADDSRNMSLRGRDKIWAAWSTVNDPYPDVLLPLND